MSRRAMFTTALSGLTAATIGLVTWVVTMASAPRYSYDPEDMGESTVYFVVLLLAALAMGFVAPRHSWLLGALLGLPGLLLSPWTAPRGDDDGLWLMIIPTLGLFVLLLLPVAGLGAWVRSHLPHGDP